MTDRKLTPEEINAWQAVTRHIKPLNTSGMARKPQRLDREKTVDDEPPQKPAKPKSKKKTPPQNIGNQRRVRRGQQAYTATLDLHGHTLKTGWAILPSFLHRQQAAGARCVLIITGKGKDGEGILRRTFLHWLETPEAGTYVSGYAPAHQRHGGGGAWYVYLRQRS